MTVSILRYFLLFMLYSILGWCMEVIYISIRNKKVVDRGFLVGPYCPIYGFGAVLITLLLNRYDYDPLVLFVMSIIMCGFLEYITSWIMEVVFKARWWDYSNEKFNLNGRVCLKNLIAFGFLGLLITYVLNPIFTGWIDKLGETALITVSSIVGTLFLIDNIISFKVVFGFRKVTTNINKERKHDNTEQITAMVKKIFSEKSFLNKRLIDAYPKLEAIKVKVKEIQGKIKEDVNEAKDNINDKLNEAKDSINDKKEEIKNSLEQSAEKTKTYLNEKNLKKKGK